MKLRKRLHEPFVCPSHYLFSLPSVPKYFPPKIVALRRLLAFPVKELMKTNMMPERDAESKTVRLSSAENTEGEVIH